MDFSAGKCGDQNYLDDWPDLYSALVISTNPGVGLGPWNVEMRRINCMNGGVLADTQAAVFYHYHSLRLLRPGWGVRATWLSGWFAIPDVAIGAFYLPYSKELWRAVDDIEMNGLRMTFGRTPDRYADMPNHQALLSVGSVPVPTSWSSRIFDLIARETSR
jgi:hypothetical protein